MIEMLMWTCSWCAANSIRLCGERSVKIRTPSVWSRYYKEKYVRNVGCTINKANTKQITFWHLFGFTSVPHASFTFVYKFGCTLRLGLHIAIFSTNIYERIHSERRPFFCTACNFFARLGWWFGRGGKIKYIKIYFLDWIPFLPVECGHSSIWSSLFYSYIYAHRRDFTRTSYPLSAEMCGEKIAAEFVDTATLVSMRSASSVKSSIDTCRKNCNV